MPCAYGLQMRKKGIYMRKVLSVIGAMILMLFLFGCKKNEANETVMATSPAVELNTVETTEETTVPATTESTDIEIQRLYL